MRTPWRTLHRAFPELDQFTDAQSERFVAAARHGVMHTLVRWTLQGAASLLAFALVAAGLAALAWATGVDPLARDSLCATSIILLVAGAAAAWLWTRDCLIRRRVRAVVRERGSCARCGYGLADLPVMPEGAVRCPECGHERVAEPDEGEIVLAGPGRPRFRPSYLIPRPVPWLTPARRKRLMRIGAWLLVLIMCSALGLWAEREWFLRRQAREAAAARTGIAGLQAFVWKHQPSDTDWDTPDAWEPFHAAVDAIAETDQELWRGDSEDAGTVYPDFEAVYDPSIPPRRDDRRPPRTPSRELAVGLIGAYRAAGVFTLLNDMAHRRRAFRPIPDLPDSKSLVELNVPELADARRLADINAARMFLADAADDMPEFLSALEANLALVRMARMQPLLIDRYEAVTIQVMTFERVRAMLARRRDAAWVKGAWERVERQRCEVPFVHAVQSETMATLDTVAWFFSDADRVRAGMSSPAIAWLTGTRDHSDQRLGTYAENRAAVAALSARTVAWTSVDPWERGASPIVASDLVLSDLMTPWMPLFRRSEQEPVYERGLDIVLALERYRCDHDRYPASLQELVPHYLARLPPDPWSGNAFGYRRSPAGVRSAETYVLYSVGGDSTDDGGVSPAAGHEAESLIQGRLTGTDFVLSPSWSESGPH